MSDKIERLTINLGPRSIVDAADDLEHIARYIRHSSPWLLPPHLAHGVVEVAYPEEEKVDEPEAVEEAPQEPVVVERKKPGRKPSK